MGGEGRKKKKTTLRDLLVLVSTLAARLSLCLFLGLR